MAKNLVIGAVNNYTYDQIKPWLHSLRKSGYDGDVAVIAYNMNKETIAKLEAENVIISGMKLEDGNLVYDQKASVVVERFGHLWNLLNKTDHEMIVATDVRDVIFQRNPFDWLETRQAPDLVVGVENLVYRDEPWNVNNMTLCYGKTIFEMMQNEPIICAGVIAGWRPVIADLCLQIFLTCGGIPHHVPGGGGPDQAALNILMKSRIYTSHTLQTNANDDFILHAGTTLKAIEAGSGGIGEAVRRDPSFLDIIKKKTLWTEPVFEEGLVWNARREPYTIVHQYDRIPEWKAYFEKEYGV